MAYYAVARGFKTGIFNDWKVVRPLVTGFSSSKFKKFRTINEAKAFMRMHSEGSQRQRRPEAAEIQRPEAQRQPDVQRVQPQAVQSEIETSERRGTIRKISDISDFEDSEHFEHFEDGELTPRQIIANNHVITQPYPGIGIDFSFDLDEEELNSFHVSEVRKVYCDGASRNNGRSDAIAGYGVYIPDQEYVASISYTDLKTDKRPTNQVMELFAIRHTLISLYETIGSLSDPCGYEVCTDSEYGIKCITEWSDKWERNNWRKAGGEPVLHADLIRECKEILKSVSRTFGPTVITFVHVRGHRGVLGNEVADVLANMACDRMQHC